MNLADYELLRDRLEQPVPSVLTTVALLESLHPHVVADDPAWPAPTDVEEETLRAFLDRFPWHWRIGFGALAAEMVIQFWARWAQGPGVSALETRRREEETRGWEPRHLDVAPLVTLEALWRWFHGTGPESEVRYRWETALDAAKVAEANGFEFAAAAARAVVDAATYMPRDAIRRVAIMARRLDTTVPEEGGDAEADRRFLRAWWMRCRARAPFGHVEAFADIR